LVGVGTHLGGATGDMPRRTISPDISSVAATIGATSEVTSVPNSARLTEPSVTFSISSTSSTLPCPSQPSLTAVVAARKASVYPSMRLRVNSGWSVRRWPLQVSPSLVSRPSPSDSVSSS
jgi:hypothetical protein